MEAAKLLDVSQYLTQTRCVEGWFFPVDAYLFALADAMQKARNIVGNFFEIGVHHGKTAIFLANLASREEILGVCDVFEQQELNLDGSGNASRGIFEANMRTFAGATSLRIFSKPSSELTIADTTASCRFFHIDGGHEPEDVYADLVTADRALLEEGVLAVDDVFNPNWPGVSEGMYRFFEERQKVFAPIAIGGNKILFTRPRMQEHYRIDSLPKEVPYTLADKQWLGYSVRTAMRHTWVDLDPIGSALEHFIARTWRDRARTLLLWLPRWPKS